MGCILMYGQAKLLPKPFRDALLQQSQILHLVRHNLLRTEVSSFMNLQKVGPTHAHSKAGDRELSIALPCDDLLTKLQTRAALIRQHREWVDQFGGLEVPYESLTENLAPEMARIAAALGLVSFVLSTELQPTNPSPLAKKLTNFDEVARCL
jgi:hypothetical protein